MKKSILPLAIILLGMLLFNSCKKETFTTSDMEIGHNFYPLEMGKYVVYDVDSLIWDDFLKTKVPSQCQLRYDVTDTFRNDTNELGYLITVRYRKTVADAYVPHDVLYAVRHDNKLVVTHHNLKFIKLTFPVADGINWNGNAMIPLNDSDNVQYDNNNWNYVYTNYDDTYNTGIKLYPHTVTVNEIDDQLNNPDEDSTAYAYKNFSQEIYAYNVGMIYRIRIYWTFQPKSPDGNSGGSGYRKGYSVIMKAVDNN